MHILKIGTLTRTNLNKIKCYQNTPNCLKGFLMSKNYLNSVDLEINQISNQTSCQEGRNRCRED